MGKSIPPLLIAAAGILAWRGAAVGAEPIRDTLTAASVLSRARSQAPEILLARTRVLEARGRLAGSRALHDENPVLEGTAATSADAERRTRWGLSVPFGLGLRRAYHVGVARAELSREELLAADSERRVVGAALSSFYRLLHVEQRRGLARERLALAERLGQLTRERHRAGDVALLDVRVAETERARAASDVRSEEAAVARAQVDVALVLGLPSATGLVAAGSLEDRPPFPLGPAPDAAEGRPDVRAAASEVEAARSDVALARSALIPRLAFRLDREHEEGRAVARPGLAVTVPLFNSGQGDRGVARARLERARLELARSERGARAEREGTTAAYEAAVAAADELEAHGLPQANETAAMAEESYRAGKIDLASFLIVRRDGLETRREYLDRLLEAALADIDRAVAAGELR